MAKGISSQGAQTLEAVSWFKQNPQQQGAELTTDPKDSTLVFGLQGEKISTITAVAPNGHPAMLIIQPIQTRARAGG